MRREELLVVGAGPAGLALSFAYAGKSLVLEQSNEVGGLCRSIEFGDAVFDIGGHSFHSPHPEVSELVENLMEGNWYTQRRDARVFFDGQLIDYPFQQHLDQISDAETAAECRRHLPKSEAGTSAQNFEDWIVERYGAGVARHFMLPYNRKLWARDLKRMSCEWVGERIASSDPAKSHDGRTRAPLARDNEVSYPAEGGFGEIYKALAKRSGPIEFDQRIVHIGLQNRTVRTAEGKSWAWDELATTMPLPVLLRAIEGCPGDLIADADQLEFVSLKLLMLVVSGPVTDEPQRVYVSDPAVPTHKIAFNHTSSPSLRKRSTQSIICEITYSPYKTLASDTTLERDVKDWLVRARLVASSQDFVEAKFVDVPYAYPVYTHARPAIVERIAAYLEPHGMHTLGRFGRWEYVNSDACIWQAMELARKLTQKTR